MIKKEKLKVKEKLFKNAHYQGIIKLTLLLKSYMKKKIKQSQTQK